MRRALSAVKKRRVHSVKTGPHLSFFPIEKKTELPSEKKKETGEALFPKRKEKKRGKKENERGIKVFNEWLKS